MDVVCLLTFSTKDLNKQWYEYFRVGQGSSHSSSRGSDHERRRTLSTYSPYPHKPSPIRAHTSTESLHTRQHDRASVPISSRGRPIYHFPRTFVSLHHPAGIDSSYISCCASPSLYTHYEFSFLCPYIAHDMDSASSSCQEATFPSCF